MYSLETIPWVDVKKQTQILTRQSLKKCVRPIKRLKGVKKHIIRQKITHEHFRRAIETGMPHYVNYFTISSRRHNVTTDEKGKLGLSR